MDLLIEAAGTVRCVFSEEIDLSQLGQLSISFARADRQTNCEKPMAESSQTTKSILVMVTPARK